MPTSELRLQPLPYFTDSSIFFPALAELPWAVYLDSGFPYCQQGRYDIIAADPVCTLVTYGELTTISTSAGGSESPDDPFALLRQQLARFRATEVGAGLPFSGGAIGYFGYDLARRLEKLPTLAAPDGQIADMMVGIYRWAIVVDHRLRQTVLVGHACPEPEWRALKARFAQPEAVPASKRGQSFRVLSPVNADLDQAGYCQAFQRIKHYLKEGDCYQVNFAQRFAASCEGDPWPLYQALRKANPAPFSGYLDLPGIKVLSSSPERFLKLDDGWVETKPIKGTLPRKADPAEDLRQIELLRDSAKDRAENLMIVDLLRNDLGKVCRQGSIKVPKLFAVESYATVHHLVSTVTGELAPGQDALALLRHCFPGGSITGAPKIRAMQIIEELEAHRRGVYCGAIGYISFTGGMDTNIAIRTMVHDQGGIRFWAGGGIVNDSKLDDEYQECFAKAKALMAVLREFRG